MDFTWGIDVSKWQGAIDWPAVERSGLTDFAAVRVTIGLTPDERWQANLAGAADHIPLPMAYAVVGTRAAQADAADLLVNLVDRVADVAKVGLVVDAESFADGSHPTMEQVHAFRDALHRLTGRWPLAYLPDWWMTQHGYATDDKPWPWWPSRYVAPPWDPARLAGLRPPLAHGFTVQGPWQFTSSGTVAGIAGNVDRNVFFGTLAKLEALTLGGDMPLSEAEWTRLGALVDAKVKAHADRIYGLVYRGDATEPETHPANLEQVRRDIASLALGLSDAQVDGIVAALAARLEGRLAPAYSGTMQLAPQPPATAGGG